MTAIAERIIRLATPPPTPAGVSVRQLLAEWAVSLRARGRSPATLKGYAKAGCLFLRHLEAKGMPVKATDLHREHVEDFIAATIERRTRATARTYYLNLHSFFAWCVQQGELPRSPMERMEPPKPKKRPPRVPTTEEMRHLLAVCDARDAAMVRLFCDSGLRLSELTRLRVEDLDLEAMVIPEVLVKGGDKEPAYFGEETQGALRRYLRGRDNGPLWLGRQGSLSADAVHQAIKRRAAQAGLPWLHAHLFRHAFADAMLRAGISEREVMTLGRWRSRAAFARYGAAQDRERAVEAYRRAAPGRKL